jgi:hypothetical protein
MHPLTEAIFGCWQVSEATARGITALSASIQQQGGSDAVSLRLAERYIEAFEQLAKEGNTILLPSNMGDPAAMVGTAMGIFQNLKGGNAGAVGPGQEQAVKLDTIKMAVDEAISTTETRG